MENFTQLKIDTKINSKIDTKIDTELEDISNQSSPMFEKKRQINHICHTFRVSGNHENFHKFLWYFFYFLKKAHDLGKDDSHGDKMIHSLLVQLFVIIKQRATDFAQNIFNKRHERTVYLELFWNHRNWDGKTPFYYCIENKIPIGIELLLSIPQVKTCLREDTNNQERMKIVETVFSIFKYDPWFFRPKTFVLFLQRCKEQKVLFTEKEMWIIYKNIKRVIDKSEYSQRKDELIKFFDCLTYGNFLILWLHSIIPSFKKEKDFDLIRSINFYYKLRKAEFESLKGNLCERKPRFPFEPSCERKPRFPFEPSCANAMV